MIYVVWLPEERMFLSMTTLTCKNVENAEEFDSFEDAQKVAHLIGGIVVLKEDWE